MLHPVITSALQRFVKVTAVRSTYNCFRKLFGRYLIVTNVSICTISGSVGDIIQQHYDILSGDKEKWEPSHTVHMGAAGVTTGVILHYWYILLEKYMPARTFKLIITKVLLDQIIYSPVNLVVLFGTVGLFEKSAIEYIKKEVLHKGWRIYMTEWYIWPPAQLINFSLVPLKYRMLFDSMISFGFDIYTPYVKYKHVMDDDDKTSLSKTKNCLSSTKLNL
ncbi:Uncharacterised protein g511 [Pycnogonum litorale]